MTADSWSKIASEIVADHEIHLFYEFDSLGVEGPATRLGDLVDGNTDWLPGDQVTALRGRYHDEKVWEKTTADVGGDFYDHLRDLVAGRCEELATFWRLTAQAMRLLGTADLYEESTPRESRIRKRLALTLSKQGSERLQAHRIAPRPLSIKLDSVTLHAFSTQTSFAHVVASVRPLDGQGFVTALELLEAQVALARINKLSWRPVKDGQSNGTSPFGLNLLVRCLAQGATAAPPRAERTRSYTFAAFAKPVSPEDSDRFGLYLARHYTTDYAVAPDIAGVERVRAFETVRHTIALEGAATIISPTDPSGSLPPFLKDFSTNTLHQHYVPIALLALHEYGFLVNRKTRSIMRYEDAKDIDNTLQNLGRLRSDSLIFRVCFRFSQVSHITMHNELNRAFRAALGLDRMLHEFHTDITEIEAFLRAVEEHKRAAEEQKSQHRLFWFSVIGGASLAGFTAFTILTATFRVLLAFESVRQKLLDWGRGLVAPEWLVQTSGAESSGHAPELLGLCFGVVIFCIAFWLISRNRPSPHAATHGDLTMHAMLEQMSATLDRE
jgi:hypothetical protein